MAVTVRFEERVEIPLSIQSLTDFRDWARSDDFPERGRIDFVAGRIEVDMYPEDFVYHLLGTWKQSDAPRPKRQVRPAPTQ